MTDEYRCRNDHVGHRGPDGGCMKCRAEASARYRNRRRSLTSSPEPMDFAVIAAASYRDEPKSLMEKDRFWDSRDRLEQQRAARRKSRQI